MADGKTVTVTQTGSPIGRKSDQRDEQDPDLGRYAKRARYDS